MKKLSEELNCIKDGHGEALRLRAAREATGPSVMRVFVKGSRRLVMESLMRVDMDTLQRLRSQRAYREWFERNLSRVARAINRLNSGNSRVQPGSKWGHATKIFCLYVRSVVLNARYFTDSQVNRISDWLYIPVDGVVMDSLRTLGVRLPFSRIKEIDSKAKFYQVQDLLSQAAKPHKIPRIWFDDVWAVRG